MNISTLLLLLLLPVSVWAQNLQPNFPAKLGLGLQKSITDSYIQFDHTGGWKIEQYQPEETKTVDEFLLQRGILPDKNSKQMYKWLNNDYDKVTKDVPVFILVPDGSGYILKKNKPFTTPDDQHKLWDRTWEEWNNQYPSIKKTPNSPINNLAIKYPDEHVGKVLFASERQRADTTQAKAGTLQIDAYNAESDFIAHRTSVDLLASAAKTFEEHAQEMGPQEVALTQIYFATANRQAEIINVQATSFSKIQSNSVHWLKEDVRPLEEIQKNVMNNKPLYPKRRVTVEVHLSPGIPNPTPLRVYMLPRIFGRTDLSYSAAEIESRLSTFTFPQLTTPSVNDRVPDAEWFIWIGQDYKFKEMAQLIITKGVTNIKSRSVAPGLNSLTLQFWATDEVVPP